MNSTETKCGSHDFVLPNGSKSNQIAMGDNTIRFYESWLLVMENGNTGCNLGVILVWVCEPVFQNVPHSYTWPLKKRTHSYTWSSKMLTYSYTVLWFFVPIYCWLLHKYHSQFILYQDDKQPWKISEWKICAYTRMSEKWGLWDIGKQCWPRSDATECIIWSGSAMFA